MSGRGKGQKPSVPTRRSTRERKPVTYGSDFVEDDPELMTPPAKPVPSRKKSTPGAEPDPLPPGSNPDPPPKPPPAPKPSKTVTWPADEEHWKEATLPRNHSKRL